MQVIDSGRILLFLYLLAGVAGMAGCSAHSDAELAWNEESGYQWAELTNSRSKQVGFQKLSSSRTRVTFRNEVRQSLKDENRHYLNGSGDRKSTRLNSSHVASSYAVFCLKK